MSERPAITGIGLVTPLGATAAQTWQALIEGRRITDHARCAPELADASPPSLRIVRIARAAAQQAIDQAGWTADHLADPATALIVGTSRGTLEYYLNPCRSDGRADEGVTGEDPYTLSWGIADVATDLASHVCIGAGVRLTVSSACASGLAALIRAVMELHRPNVRRALVVATEASVHPLFLGAFGRMGVLADPALGCRPFDRQRGGFLLSEIAAAACVEWADDAVATGNAKSASPGPSPRPLVFIDRYALAADAQHLTHGDADGRVLRHLLMRVLDRGEVDLVHAHGTGTPANDAIELSALEAAMPPDALPLLYSHKGALGHSLGASGLVAVVLNCLCHTHAQVPGNVATVTPLPTSRLRIVSTPVQCPIRHSLTLCAGFGGTLAAVRLTTADATNA